MRWASIAEAVFFFLTKEKGLLYLGVWHAVYNWEVRTLPTRRILNVTKIFKKVFQYFVKLV